MYNIKKTKDIHIGNLIGPGVENNGIKEAIGDFYRHVNITLARFSKVAPDVKYQLFKSYCMNIYGCELWDYSHSSIELFFTAWRKCVRRVWSLPPRTHCHLLPMICNDISIESQMHKRFLKFVSNIISSNNNCLRIMGQMVLDGSGSATCNSVNYICHIYKLNKYRDIVNSKITQIAHPNNNDAQHAVYV
jgi:hypothetical protein